MLCQKKKEINELHRDFGHPNEVVTRNTAKKLKIPLQGIFLPCADCAVGKAKQKKVSKALVPQATRAGERFFLI